MSKANIIKFKGIVGEEKKYNSKGELISDVNEFKLTSIKEAEYLAQNYKNQNFCEIECVASIIVDNLEDTSKFKDNKDKDVNYFNEIIKKAYEKKKSADDVNKELLEEIKKLKAQVEKIKADTIKSANKMNL